MLTAVSSSAFSCQQFCSQLSAVLLSAVSSSALSCPQFCSQLSADLLSIVSAIALSFFRKFPLSFPHGYLMFSARLLSVFIICAFSY